MALKTEYVIMYDVVVERKEVVQSKISADCVARDICIRENPTLY